MSGDMLTMVLKMIISLAFIIFLIYAISKYGGSSLQKVQKGRYLRILERVPMSKDSSLMVVKMGDKAYVVSSTSGRIEILKEIDDEAYRTLQEVKSIPEFKSVRDLYNNLKSKGR